MFIFKKYISIHWSVNMVRGLHWANWSIQTFRCLFERENDAKPVWYNILFELTKDSYEYGG